jgi:dTDP-4-dehydrorhamnose reductase
MTSTLRVLVTGAGGRLGGRLAEILSTRHHVIASRHETPPPAALESVPLDLLSPASLEQALGDSRADAVVHAAALADADRCERQPLLALRVNVEATARLARACRLKGVRFVALSTDLVGAGDHAFATEADAPQPRLLYGVTKVAAEEAALAADPGAAIVRVALVHGRGFGAQGTASESIAWALRSGSPLRLYTDQFRTPVDPESVAQALSALVQGEARGLFHLGGPERVSRYELGLRTARALGLSADGITAATVETHPPKAPRPADVSLDSSRAMRELGYRPRPLDDGLRESRAVQG